MPSRYIDVTLPFIGKIPMTRLGISLLSLVLVAGVALGIYVKVYRDPEATLITLREVNARLTLEVVEYNKHIMEAPERHELLINDVRGELAVAVFSDGCVVLNRKIRDGQFTRLVPDLTNEVKTPKRTAASAGILPTVHAADVHAVPAQQAAPCSPRWMHPPPFQWRYGARIDHCWVEVIRVFSDHCSHVQLFNACSSYFDAWPDGSPRVRWVICSHE